MLYQKKPIKIDAFQLGEEAMPLWFIEEVRNGNVSNIDAFLQSTNEIVKIKTLEGIMSVTQGDWIIKGVKGEIYPCKDEIFKATYDYVPLRHIKKDDELAGKFIYIDETNILDLKENDVIVCDEKHKIVTKMDENRNITTLKLIDENEDKIEEIPLYENGKRLLDAVLVPETFMAVTEINEDSIAYEILKVEK